MRCESPQELATRPSVVDAQEHVSAEVRRRPVSEDGCLDLMQLERRRGGRKIAAAGFFGRNMGASFPVGFADVRTTLGYDLVQEFVHRLADALQPRVSATVRSGWATYQPPP